MTTQRRVRSRTRWAAGFAALAIGVVGIPAMAQAAPDAAGTAKVAAPRHAADLDVMFIGAHPDDEAGRLSMYGQWGEDYGVRTGVITVTRGEGGGNAVGPQEGPQLGLIREAEERRAVGRAGITDVYNLDDLDFYYTVSEPLTNKVWSSDTLEKVVRVIRKTTPEVLFTMDPAPSPGNHGNHQEAALLALMAYEYAGDASKFPEQITNEGLKPWSPSKLFGGARGKGGAGASCPTAFEPERPTQDIYGVWGGNVSAEHKLPWAQVERLAQREYASQGWSVWGDAAANPACDYFAQFAARVPFERGNQSAATADPGTALRGALLVDPNGLPFGTGLELRTSAFQVVPGGTATLEVVVTAPADHGLRDARVALTAPTGWTLSDTTVNIGDVAAGKTATASATVTVSADATTNARSLVEATVSAAGGKSGYTNATIEVVPLVRGTQELLPQVAVFQTWATAAGFPEMEGFVVPVVSMPVGGTRDIAVDVVNHSTRAQSGTVTLAMGTGFSATPASLPFTALAPGASTQVTFAVTNTDATMNTSNAGGDYPYTITTATSAGVSKATGNIELVPSVEVPHSDAAPTVDGVIDANEYTATMDISRKWEGADCTDAADCSGTARVARHGDDLYLAVDVRDDVIGTLLDAGDCKRHWRTDSIEIAIDPQGRSENTSTTFKSLILPVTVQGPGCFGRDADNHQGDAQTAPGVEIATHVSDPFAGYTVEARIPASVLPQTVDPEHMGLNVFFYDSDTQNKTGQTRLGWSTWGGVQGDPYRWGVARFPGWTPPTITDKAPVLPADVLSSFNSPQTIDQAVRTGVAIAGRPGADPASTASVVKAWAEASQATVVLNATGSARAHVFVLDAADNVVGSRVLTQAPGLVPVTIAISGTPARVLVAAAADSGGSTSSGVAVTDAPASTTAITLEPTRPIATEPTTAVVAVDGAGLPATGEVQVTLDGTAVGTTALVEARARIELGKLSVGRHTLRATYPGAGLLPGSEGVLEFEVSATGTGTTVPPVDSLTDANRGTITVPAQAKRSQTITVTAAGVAAGTVVDTWMYSTPTWMGTRTVSSAGTYQVTISKDATLGAHRIAVFDGQGKILGWAPITIVADSSAGLALTGVQIGMIALAASLLVGAGIAFVIVRRRRAV